MTGWVTWCPAADGSVSFSADSMKRSFRSSSSLIAPGPVTPALMVRAGRDVKRDDDYAPAAVKSPAQVETELRARFSAEGDPSSAVSQKAYMKSALSFHGVTMATVRAAGKELCSGLDHTAMIALAEGLTSSAWFDVRSVGIAVLERKARELESADIDWLIALVRRTRCWAHVDGIATKLVGAVLREDPGLLQRLPVWARDEDFWVRRTALLGQLEDLNGGLGSFELFEQIAAPMLPEREFFIRKAIGWVLRDVSKKRPELAFRFLLANRQNASGLTMREGAKYLPAPMRKQLGLEVA